MNLGEYHIVAKIGQGGMAEVFKATKTGAKGFEKTFALKRILPPFSDKQHFTAMLFDEAHLQSQLNHPNLIQVYDFAHDQEQYYLIMEYVNGISLKDLCRHLWSNKLPIPWYVSLYILSQTLKALHYIHHKKNKSTALEIVHRDVSPQNILLAHNGQIKLADFGIAWSKLKQEHTRSGVLKGKTSYLSPQQIKGDNITAFTDVFACAIILYELICQRNPFLGQTDFETMKNIEAHHYTDSKQFNFQAPEKIHSLIADILNEHNPDFSAQDMLNQLNTIQDKQWLSNGDILFSAWMEQLNLKALNSEAQALNKTVILTEQNTQTLKSMGPKKKHSIALLSIVSLILILLRSQAYFQMPAKQDEPQQSSKNEPAMMDLKKTQIISPSNKEQAATLTNTINPKKISKKSASPSLKGLSKLSFMGPEESKIFIDGHYKQTLPAESLHLKPGIYLVRWTLKTGQNKIKRIQLTKDSTKILLWHSF